MGTPARVTVAPKQSLGQNFLVDENIARKIVGSLHLTKEDVVVEIGPGQGALTQFLAGTAKHLLAMEIDQRVIGGLEEKFASDNVEILHQDFLTADLRQWSRKYRDKLHIVGNIPYHLTSAILFKVFEEHQYIHNLTMMVQREVALRIAAQPDTKAYGILSLFSRFYGTPRLLFNVSPNCFYPRPKVTSTVVQLTLHEKLPEDVNVQLFGTIVKTTFGKRRKTLRNSLKYLPFEEKRIQHILDTADFALEKRPEQLGLDEFITLTKQIEKIGTCP